MFAPVQIAAVAGEVEEVSFMRPCKIEALSYPTKPNPGWYHVEIHPGQPNVLRLSLKDAIPSTDISPHRLIGRAGQQTIASLAELDSFEHRSARWFSDESEPPSASSIMSARMLLLRALRANLAAHRVTPSAEGGVAVIFRSNNKYADVEFLNSGEILALISNEKGFRHAWEADFNNLSDTIKSICEYLQA